MNTNGSTTRRVRLVNLTPHTIDVLSARMSVVPSGTVARAKETNTTMEWIDCGGMGIPIVNRVFGEVEGLPPREEGTIYITSAIVAQAAWANGRDDVVSPGDVVRNSDGRVVACNNLVGRG